MEQRNKGVPHSNRAEDETREQEVVRANKELAAYFKGERTEREARAALKTIKAFVRHREHVDPSSRRPLPGAQPPQAAKGRKPKPKKTASAKVVRRRPKRPVLRELSTGAHEREVASTTPSSTGATDD